MSDALRPEELTVAVAGGALRVCRWPGDGPAVLAAHGITANALAFARVAEALAGRVTLIAPDLRGRGGSRELPGPYGMTAHADDLIAVADHLGLDRFTMAGHSMGGFAAATTAARYPSRVTSVLLIDGGVAFPVPAGADVDTVLDQIIGPAMRRLSMTFADERAYLDFFHAHPALADEWGPYAEAYVRRDMIGRAPEIRSSCVSEAIRADAASTLMPGSAGVTAVRRVSAPVRLLWAARGLLNEAQGLYDESRLASAAVPGLTTEMVPGVNHYTILLAAPGAAAVASHL